MTTLYLLYNSYSPHPVISFSSLSLSEYLKEEIIDCSETNVLVKRLV